MTLENNKEPQGLLRILASVFSGVLFGFLFSKLRTPYQDSEGPHHPQDSTSDATQVRQNVPSPIHVIVDASPPTPTPSVERESREERQEGRDKKRFRVEIIMAVVLAIYTVVTGLMWRATKNAADSAKDSADWTKDQAKNIFNEQRPKVWVKMPDIIHIEVGKPVRLNIQVFNYGKVPGMVRARIRFEAAPGVIEKFRDILRNHQEDFLVPDQLGTLKVLINPLTGRSFPIETPELVLSKQDMDKLAAGNIDVAIYGRIFYTDLDNAALGKRNDAYQSSFCFYVMRDGTTTSACTNKYNAYTNYEEYTNWAH